MLRKGVAVLAIRAIIFDFDGLILDTESPLHTSWMEVFAHYGLVVTQEEWASLLGASADVPEAYELLEAHLGRPLDRKRIHEQRMARELQLLDEEDVLPGVRELIHEAKTASFGLAVASSSDRAWVEGLLTRHDLIQSFDTIVCAEDVAQTKPAPDLFLKALKQLHVEAHEAIIFEDSEHGVSAAKAAGIFCVAVPNKVTRCLAFADASLIVTSIADYSLHDYTERATSTR
jgi:HAD superfamily hydrolase (TIGR01509 family)